MTVMTSPPPLPAIPPPLPLRRFTVDEYHRMIDRQVEVFTGPSGPDAAPLYRTRQDYKLGELVPFVLDSKDIALIAVQELLP